MEVASNPELCDRKRNQSISGLVAEYIVAIDVTRVRFPADAFHLSFYNRALYSSDNAMRLISQERMPSDRHAWTLISLCRDDATILNALHNPKFEPHNMLTMRTSIEKKRNCNHTTPERWLRAPRLR